MVSQMDEAQSKVDEYTHMLAKHGLATIKDLKKGPTRAVFGVVLYRSETSITKRQQYMYSLHVADPSLDGGNETMNVFNVDKSQLPDVQEQDIIIMKDSYVDDFNKRRSNSGHNGTAYALFRGDQAPEQVESQAKKCALNDIDLEIVNYLFEWNKERKTQQDDAPTVSRARQLIETCRLGDNGVKWLNYIGMIVKYTPTTEKFQKGSKAVLVLTDYTVNPSPSATSDLGINYAKFYPLNNEHMLVCTLWDNHADDCPDLEQGDYVYLDNCKRKFNSMGCLELNINGKDGDKNKVRKVTENDPIVQKLLERQGHQQQKKRKREQYESCFIRTRIRLSLKNETLNEIFQSETSGTHKTKAYISKFSPPAIKDWIIAWCLDCLKSFEAERKYCASCQEPTTHIFKFIMSVEDDSDSCIFVNMWGEDARSWLGLEAKDVYNNPEQIKRLQKVVEILTNENDRLYLEFGIESYQEANIDGEKGCYFDFKITNTELLVEDD